MAIDSKTAEQLPAVCTTDEVARYLRLTRETVQDYIRAGEMRAATCGRVYRIRREWVDEFLTRRSNPSEL